MSTDDSGGRWEVANVYSHLVQDFFFRIRQAFSLELGVWTLERERKKCFSGKSNFPFENYISGPSHELSRIMMCSINCNLKAFPFIANHEIISQEQIKLFGLATHYTHSLFNSNDWIHWEIYPWIWCLYPVTYKFKTVPKALSMELAPCTWIPFPSSYHLWAHRLGAKAVLHKADSIPTFSECITLIWHPFNN